MLSPFASGFMAGITAHTWSTDWFLSCTSTSGRCGRPIAHSRVQCTPHTYTYTFGPVYGIFPGHTTSQRNAEHFPLFILIEMCCISDRRLIEGDGGGGAEIRHKEEPLMLCNILWRLMAAHLNYVLQWRGEKRGEAAQQIIQKGKITIFFGMHGKYTAHTQPATAAQNGMKGKFYFGSRASTMRVISREPKYLRNKQCSGENPSSF